MSMSEIEGKDVHCDICKRHVGRIREGSKLMKGMVCLCPTCNVTEQSRRMRDDMTRNGVKKSEPDFSSIFGDVFSGKND